ncbi:ribosomal protein L17 [Pelagophyceae sp. CCMP2097]|nr:ribosomal protein L17 [Pelagophyceae sp. CCMP2097]
MLRAFSVLRQRCLSAFAPVCAPRPVFSLQQRGFKHGVGRRKLGRGSSHRWAMLRNMVTSLINHERIRTTTNKAKEVKKLGEKMIRWGKLGNLHGKQQAARVIRETLALRKLFEVLGPRYETRNGGYCRVLKMAKFRKGDGAEMSIVEYVDRDGELRIPRPPRPLPPLCGTPERAAYEVEKLAQRHISDAAKAAALLAPV